MDGPDKVVSSSASSKVSVTPKGTDENNQSYQEMGFNLQNSKKHAAKNFMSPTISATSKANLPRKKVLAEITEFSRPNFSYTNIKKTPYLDPNTAKQISNLDSKATTLSDLGFDNTDSSLSQNTQVSSRGSEFNGNEQDGLVDDLSSRPYDPLANYISPRPKFLRYKPNRGREIFLRRENEVREGKDGLMSASFDSKKSIDEDDILLTSENSLACSCSSQEGPLKEEDDENDEELEEIVEESGWNLRGVLKFLLLLIVLVFSTMYISSMKSPEPSLPFEALKGLTLKDGYYKIQNHVLLLKMGITRFKIMSMLPLTSEDGYHFFDKIERTKMGFVELNQTVIIEGIEVEKDVIEYIDEVCEVVVDKLGEIKGGESEVVETIEGEEKRLVDKLGEIVELEGRDGEDVCEDETGKTGDAFDQIPHLSGGVDQKVKVSDVISNVLEKETEVVMEPVEEVYSEEARVEKMDGSEMGRVSDVIPNVLEKETEVVMEPVEEVYSEEASVEKMDGSEMGISENATSTASEVMMPEIIVKDTMHFETLNFEAEENPEGGLIELIETKLLFEAIIGVSICFAIVFSLMWGFHLKRKSNVTEESSTITKPCFEAVVAERNSLVLSKEKEQYSEQVDSFENAMSLTNSMEDSKELYQSQAPSVEFLGEFVVGEVSSSLRSYGMKSRIKDDEVSSHSVPIHAKPDISVFSTKGSPSYGSFTSEKILKKEEHGDGDAKKVVTTPVRRSSRIRNRAILSP